MRRALILLVLVGVMVGAAVAEEPREEVEVEVEDEEVEVEGKQLASLAAFEVLKLAKKSFLGTLFQVASQIVVLIALVLLISTLKKSGAIFGTGEDYEYYHVPAAYPSASSSGSSYSSGYSKRSADDLPASNAFMDLPVVQRLTERVNSAIENFKA